MKDKTTLRPEEFETIKGTMESHQYNYSEGRGLYVKNIRNIRGVAEMRRKAKKFILYTVVAGQELYLSPEEKLTADRKQAKMFYYGLDDTEVRCNYWQNKLKVKFNFRNFEAEKKLSKKEEQENKLRAAENEKQRNYEKFFTPSTIATFMAKLLRPKQNRVYLEPSAGSGNLIKAVKVLRPEASFVAVEQNKEHKKQLIELAEKIEMKDFLTEYTCAIPIFDGCIANPPFGNSVDLRAHINKIKQLVKSKGRIVVIVPKDFRLGLKHKSHKVENWSKNSDGSNTEIKIIEFINP